MNNLNGEFSVQEEGEYNQGIPNLKEIALKHIGKISEICCSEFSKGYWEERPLKVGSGIAITKTYHPDQRAVFCNAVDFLVWIVTPNSDSEFKEYVIKLKEPEKLETTKEDWDKKLEQRKETFRKINEMFNRTNYFDSMTGRTER